MTSCGTKSDAKSCGTRGKGDLGFREGQGRGLSVSVRLCLLNWVSVRVRIRVRAEDRVGVRAIKGLCFKKRAYSRNVDENYPVWCTLFESVRFGSLILALMDVFLIRFLK